MTQLRRNGVESETMQRAFAQRKIKKTNQIVSASIRFSGRNNLQTATVLILSFFSLSFFSPSLHPANVASYKRTERGEKNFPIFGNFICNVRGSDRTCHSGRFCSLSSLANVFSLSSFCQRPKKKMSNSSTKDHVEGNLHKAKGSVKESVGHAIGNEKM